MIKVPSGLEDVLRPLSTNLNLRQVAVAGFVIGVLFHACVAVAVIDGGGGESARGPAAGGDGLAPGVALNTVAPGVTASPSRTAAPHRTDCAGIRGTDYRSEAERQWFTLNCR